MTTEEMKQVDEIEKEIEKEEELNEEELSKE